MPLFMRLGLFHDWPPAMQSAVAGMMTPLQVSAYRGATWALPGTMRLERPRHRLRPTAPPAAWPSALLCNAGRPICTIGSAQQLASLKVPRLGGGQALRADSLRHGGLGCSGWHPGPHIGMSRTLRPCEALQWDSFVQVPAGMMAVQHAEAVLTALAAACGQDSLRLGP